MRNKTQKLVKRSQNTSVYLAQNKRAAPLCVSSLKTNKQTNKKSGTNWRNENYGACMLFIYLFTNLLISPNDCLFFSCYYCPCFRLTDTRNINISYKQQQENRTQLCPSCSVRGACWQLKLWLQLSFIWFRHLSSSPYGMYQDSLNLGCIIKINLRIISIEELL